MGKLKSAKNKLIKRMNKNWRETHIIATVYIISPHSKRMKCNIAFIITKPIYSFISIKVTVGRGTLTMRSVSPS